MTRVELLRISLVLVAFGYGLLTDANIDRIIKDGTVVKSAEAGSGKVGISTQPGMTPLGFTPAYGDFRSLPGGTLGPNALGQRPRARGQNEPAQVYNSYIQNFYRRQPSTTVRPSTTTTARRTIRRTGVYVATLPHGCIRMTMHGYPVWRCDGVYYQPQGGRYVVVKF